MRARHPRGLVRLAVLLAGLLVALMLAGLPPQGARAQQLPSVAITPETGDCTGPDSIRGRHFPPNMHVRVFHLEPSGEERPAGENETDASGSFAMPFPPHLVTDCRPGSRMLFEVRVLGASGDYTGATARAEYVIEREGTPRAAKSGQAGLADGDRGMSPGEGAALLVALAAVVLLGRYASGEGGRRW